MPVPQPILPGAGGPPGAAPPGFPRPPGPPGGTGPAAVPQPMQGSKQSGVAAVSTAIKALQEALPSLAMGSDIHKAVLKAVTDLAKHLESAHQPDQNAIIQQLSTMAKGASMAPGAASPFANAAPMIGGGGAMGGGGPPPPPPGPA